jgi:hypothetical protein
VFFSLLLEQGEAIFDAKLAGMTNFDSFMDYNAMLWTDDLDGCVWVSPVAGVI